MYDGIKYRYRYIPSIIICLKKHLVFQVSADKKYNNESELIDGVLDNVMACMQELNVNPGNIMVLFIRFKKYFRKLYLYCGTFK